MGAAGFEPTTPGFGGRYSIQMSYAPAPAPGLFTARAGGRQGRRLDRLRRGPGRRGAALLGVLTAWSSAWAQDDTSLQCPPGGEVTAGDDVTIECLALGGPGPARVTLFYKGLGDQEYRPLEMRVQATGLGTTRWSARLPGTVVGGTWLPFYVEAYDESGAVVARAGYLENPALLVVRADPLRDGTPPGTPADAAGDPLRDPDEPLLRTHAQAATVPGSAPHGGKRWSLALTAGSGLGYARGPIETYRSYQTTFRPGLAHPGIGQGMIEVGWRFTGHLALGLLGRAQLVRPTRGGESPWSALLGLARLVYLPAGGAPGAYLLGTAGWGDGFRLVVHPRGVSGVRVTDTVRGGALVFGAGAGYVVPIPVADSALDYGWVFEAQALRGAPDASMVLDLHTGLRVAF